MTAAPTSTTRDDRDREHDLLTVACREQAAARAAEVRLLTAVRDYAVHHPPIDAADRSTVRVPVGSVDGATTGVALNGPGVPVVSASAVAELGAALGLSTDAARTLVGEVLELAFRLPETWSRVLAGQLLVWRARQVATATITLPDDAAAFVDAQLVHAPRNPSGVLVGRLVEAALARFDPEELQRRTREQLETRHLDVLLDRAALGGTVPVVGLVDLPDGVALDAALAHGAAELAALGSVETLDARRARAAGDMARDHLALVEGSVPDGPPVPDGHASAGRGRPRPSRRELLLVAHVPAEAVTDPGRACSPPARDRSAVLGRVEATRSPVDIEAIRRWTADPRTKVTVQPVIDLGGHLHAESYEVPPRLRRQISWRDLTCVFPFCTRPATVSRTRSDGAGGTGRTRRSAVDLDHVEPFDHVDPARGGPTASENLSPLCRHHHNLKTSGRWRYAMPELGVVVWTSPAGRHYLRDHTGTRPLSPDT